MGSIKTTPEIRWGVVGAGMISSWFVSDILLERVSAPVIHTVTAIGSSSIAKGEDFVANHIPAAHSRPKIYDNYAAVYTDPDVDVVYIGTPHAFHKENCLDAIAAGKNVLCEKPFAINTREAREVLDAAKKKGVFVMEAMWTRFHPLMIELRKQLFEQQAIGDIRRTFCDFGLDMNIDALGEQSRLKNKALGAGSLLDIGIYSLTWGLCTLEEEMAVEEMEVKGMMNLINGVDISSSVVIKYKPSGRTGILTSTMEAKTEDEFARIEGTTGYIVVRGLAASAPYQFTIYPKVVFTGKSDMNIRTELEKTGEVHNFEIEGKGFHFEADAVAADLLAGRLENAIMPHSETLRVMELMDEIRRQGGLGYPQDHD